MNGRCWSLVLLGAAMIAGMTAASIAAPPDDWRAVMAWARERRATLPPAPDPAAVLAAAERLRALAATATAAANRAVDAGAAATGDATDDATDANGGATSSGTGDGTGGATFAAAGGAAHARRATPPAVGELTVDAVLAQLQAHLVELRREEPTDQRCLAAMPTVDTLLAAALAPDSAAAASAALLLRVLAAGCELAGARAPLQQAVGVRFVEQVIEAADDPWLQRAPREVLLELGPALAAADALVAPHTDLPVRITLELLDALDGDAPIDPFAIGLRSPLDAWRHGFSVRRSGMARAATLSAAVQEFDRATPGTESWSTRLARLQRLAGADRARGAELLRPLLDGVVDHETMRQRVRAQLRLLRLAVAVRAGDAATGLLDPLTDTPLLVERDGAAVSCRCPSGTGERRVVPLR